MNLAHSNRNQAVPACRGVARRAFALAIAFALVSAVALPAAQADEKTLADIDKVAKAAMDNYDNFDVEQAKKQLTGAIALAKKRGVENEPSLARVHVYLAIVYFSGDNDADSARDALVDAVKLDPKVTIPVVYKNDELESMLDSVKAELGAKRPRGPDCGAIEGLEHTILDIATAGADFALSARLGSDVDAAKVSLFYRLHGVEGASPDFTEIPMRAGGRCEYQAAIPGNVIRSGVIHYYIAAFDKSGAEVASKGGERTPNIVEIEGAGGGGTDADNPFSVGKGSKGSGGPRRIFVSAAFGTGAGLVTGETEQMAAPVNTGLAPALLHVFPEVGYYLNPQSSISAAFRLGFPIGANVRNHATAAVAGVVRYRQALSADGAGLYWSAALGGGMIRQTIELADAADETMNVDITTIGPLFVGGGAGYVFAISDAVRFVAELDTLVGLPVVKSIGTTPRLNFGVQFDLNVGMVLAF